MTKKEILQAAEKNALNYCIQRGLAKSAFVDGALWALKYCREVLKNALDAENSEFEYGHNVNHICDEES